MSTEWMEQLSWHCTLKFTSQHALSPEQGMVFWSRGSRFHAAGGEHTYEWEADIFAADAVGALVFADMQVKEILLLTDIANHAVLEASAVVAQPALLREVAL